MDSSKKLLESNSSGSDKELASTSVNVTDQDSGLPSSVEMNDTPAAQSAAGEDEDEDIFEQVTMILRKRRGWGPGDLLEDDDDELVEEDDAGCPLPSTPEDTQLIEAEVSPKPKDAISCES